MTIIEILAVMSPIVSVCVALITVRRNQKTDDSTSAREMGALLTEIGYIKSQLDSVNHKLELADNRHTSLVERLSMVEESAKSAHHRLDTMERKEDV
jgi:predicted  nucleic acid-binding Zn-ribbon protein